MQSWSSATGLPDNTIRTLFEDNEGNVWVGMRSGGLGRWRRADFLSYGQQEGLLPGLASVVLADESGDLWVGNWAGAVMRLRNGKAQSVKLAGAAPHAPIRSLCRDGRHGIWIGTWNSGLYHHDGRAVTRYLTGTESPANSVSALLVDRTGSLWVGTYKGVLKYTSGVPQAGREQVLIPGILTTSLVEMPTGEILVGTPQGLYVLNGSYVTVLTRKDGLSNNSVISISLDRMGGVWVGTKAGGLDRLQGRKLRSVTGEGGLPALPVNSMLDDGTASLWIGTPSGVLRVARTQLYELSEGRRSRLDTTLFGKSTGYAQQRMRRQLATVGCHRARWDALVCDRERICLCKPYRQFTAAAITSVDRRLHG